MKKLAEKVYRIYQQITNVDFYGITMTYELGKQFIVLNSIHC